MLQYYWWLNYYCTISGIYLSFQALFALVVLMEYKLQVLGHKTEEERIWSLILEARALVNKLRQTKQVLHLFKTSLA